MTEIEIVRAVKRRLTTRLARAQRHRTAVAPARWVEDGGFGPWGAALFAADGVLAASQHARDAAKPCKTQSDLLTCGNTLVWDTTIATLALHAETR